MNAETKLEQQTQSSDSAYKISGCMVTDTAILQKHFAQFECLVFQDKSNFTWFTP